MVGSQPDRIRKYLRMVAAVTPPAIAELRDAIQGADPPAIRRAAHKLAGSCGMVGARRLAEISEAIERLDPATAAVEVAPLYRRLQDAFQEALTFALAY
jgi:HPt (histidine-containing phosphotransfer) domain-containing protein